MLSDRKRGDRGSCSNEPSERERRRTETKERDNPSQLLQSRKRLWSQNQPAGLEVNSSSPPPSSSSLSSSSSFSSSRLKRWGLIRRPCPTTPPTLSDVSEALSPSPCCRSPTSSSRLLFVLPSSSVSPLSFQTGLLRVEEAEEPGG